MKLFTFSLLMVMQIFAFSIRFSFAVTAYPHPVEYELPDGTVIKIRLKGDEKIKWAETLDGYSILMNDEGFYEYAILDSNGDMLRSGIRVSPIEKRTQNETNWLSKTDKGLMFSQSQVGLMKQIWNIKREEALKTFPTTGNRKLVCILIGFTDKAFIKTQTEFNNLFNQVGYTTGGATGSVKDYYLENSYNQFNLTVDVAGPFTASNNMAYYGANDANGNDIRPRELAAEAVNLADPSVNYSNYDNDGDGWVDGVYMIYAGYGEDAGASPNTIWSHAWYLITPLYKDGVYISRYSCSPELRGNSGTTITAIGVICHEFGHVLGAPDYYDTDYATGGQYTGTGQWDMMAEGSWNNNGVTPAHHNGYTKVYYYQWASATTLSTGQNITLSNASQNSNSFYRYNTTTTNEFFLLENREMHLFDSYIPGSGMIIYHVHSGVNAVGNTINATHPQRMYPVSQNATSDPTSTPSSYGNINSASCAWNGTGKTSFTDATLPSSKSWAGANTNKPITSISRNANAKTVSFVFMGGGQSGPTISVSPTSLTQMLPANQTITQIVTVSNTGGSALTFNLAVNSTANSINELPENNDNTSYNLPVGGDRSSPFAQDTFADVKILPQINKMPGASYTENFDDITTLPSSGWALINKSSPAGTISWFQGSGTIFPAQSGAATSYIGANYNSTSGTGTISNWLISPVTAFQNGHSFSFWTRTTTASSWPDRLEVRLSSNGSSTNVGTLATDVGDFSTLIFSVNPTLVTGGYPETWTQYTVTLSGITGTINGRIGFRYFVTNGGPSGN
ncbi:MAG: M6 family metalloprotease domain-containing protein, partial [Bacteroidales bacterium]|nr:M6 family metalloprotease domain-containing protein [Bacteroidales bacterium]